MMTPSMNQVILTYLYGSNDVPQTFLNQNIIRAPNSIVSTDKVSSQSFMSGPGRFALPSSFTAIGDFFDNQSGNDLIVQLFENENSNEIRLSKEEWVQGILGLTSSSLVIDHKDFDDGQGSYAERVYVWGNTSFQFCDDAKFVVTRTLNSDGSFSYIKSIENFSVTPRLDIGENFDFFSADGTTTQTQGVSEHAIDPSGIGRTVAIGFTDDIPRTTFTETDYWVSVSQFGDLGYGRFELNLPRQLQLQSGTQEIFNSLFSTGITAMLYQEKLVVYGTDGNDHFNGWVTPAGHNLLQQYDSVGPYSFLLPQFEYALNGLVFISGSGDDTVIGTSKDDLILDGDGADTYDGQGGFDLISYAESNGAVQVNLFEGTATGGTAVGDNITGIEGVLGSSSNDSFTSSGTQIEIFAGGSGADTFNVLAGNNGPAIIWGGEGADRIVVPDYAPLQPVGILVVEASNISVDNFHLLDLDMFGLGDNFDWSQIDVVIVNPDASDRIIMDDQELEIVEQYVEVADWHTISDSVEEHAGLLAEIDAYLDAGYVITSDEIATNNDNVDGVTASYRVIQFEYHANTGFALNVFDDGFGGGGIAGTFDASFLSTDRLFSVFAAAGGRGLLVGVEYDGEQIGGAFDYDIPGSPIHIAPTVNVSYTSSAGDEITWERTNHFFLSGTYLLPNGYFGYYGGLILQSNSGEGGPLDFGYTNTDNVVYSTPELIGNWFIVGGELNGSSIVSSSDGFTVTIPESPSELNGMPRGGRFGSGGDGSNLTNGSGTTRLTHFDANRDTVVINGAAVSGSDVPEGVSVAEIEGSVVISYGQGNHVVLRGVTLEAWQMGANAQIQGTSSSESVNGTALADVITAGGGADTISAGAGDDRINYTSGDDVILGNGSNTGVDTLDLRRFSAEDVTFSISGTNVLVETTDGVIQLEAQVNYDLGHENSNIDMIAFSDMSLDEGLIRFRAVSDQSTDGADIIIGTAFGDVIFGNSGDDTMTGGAGSDVFMFDYSSEDDLIMDFSLVEDRLLFVGMTLSDIAVCQLDLNTIIDYGDNGQLILSNVSSTSLQEHNFEFV